MKRAAKIDSNQPDIVTAFRGLGCSVQSLGAVGKGCPDLLVGVGTETGLCLNLLAEVKSHPAGTIAGEPNEDQAEWAADWRGQKPAIIRSVEDAGRLVKNARTWAEMLVRRLTEGSESRQDGSGGPNREGAGIALPPPGSRP